MRYFVAFIGTYNGNNMCAGNTMIESEDKITMETVAAIEALIKRNQQLDSVAIINFQEVPE